MKLPDVWVATVDLGERGDLRDPYAGPVGVFLTLEDAKLVCAAEWAELVEADVVASDFEWQDTCLVYEDDAEEYSIAEYDGLVFQIHLQKILMVERLDP